MQELLDDYIHEAGEQVQELENQLLLLEPGIDCSDIIPKVFRVIHNLKGTSGMYGFENIVKLTHDLETVFDDLRSNKVQLSKEIVDITFEAADFVKHLLHSGDKLVEGTEHDFESLIHRIAVLSGGKKISNSNSNSNSKSHHKDQHKGYSVFFLEFKPEKNIFKRGINLQAIIGDIRSMGNTLEFQNGDDLTLEEQVERKECLSSWDFVIYTDKKKQTLESILLFMDDSEFKIVELSAGGLLNKDEVHSFVLSLLKDTSQANIAKLHAYCDSVIIQTDDTLKHQSRGKVPDKQHLSDIVKVSSIKLDHLMNLVSELVTSKAHLEILAQRINDQELLKAVEQLDKLSKRFRDNALEIRVVPLGNIIPKFKRLVHDLSQELGKQIDFIVEGADTELDKNIISSLENPLMHIIRNAADHRIESAEERMNAGKSTKGLLKFVSFYSGSNVFIQIQDDGAGINIDKLKEKAINQGFINESDSLSNKDILNLIFLPGFSTASNITDISGRGVGMDVVKKTIEDLRGEIDITTEIGLGTSFTLKLPLTLSIIDTLHVKVADISFLVPLSDVDLCDNVISSQQKTSRNAFEINGELVPFIDLRKEFGLDEDLSKHKIIIIKKEDKKMAMVVDNIVGQHQAVIKPLGLIFKEQDFLSGGSIMGDGTVALVLDTNKIASITK